MTADPRLARALAPRTVALVGASDRPGSLGALLWRNLEGFTGEVLPVSPNRVAVGGRPAAASLRDLATPVDLAVVAVPATAAPAVAADAAAADVAGMVVLSGGFAETGPEGARLQDQMVAAARAGGVRLIGPNCLGVQNCDLGLNASLAAGLAAGGGGISLVTQSGAYGMAIHALGLEEQARFAKVVAIGNAADVSAADVVAYLAADASTSVCAVLLEGARDGRAFIDAARTAAARKPVVVTKTGRSPAGARAARSHTAALAGRADLWDAALEAVGVTVARSGLEMLDVARAFATQPPPARPRAGIVTNSGGTGVELADLLALEGVDVPALSAPVQERLRALLPAHASAANPVDLTPAWARFTELYPAVVDALARGGEVDVVVPVLLQRAAADEAVAVALRDIVARLRADRVETPVAVCWVAPRAERAGAGILQAAGIPCFDWPERTARAVGRATARGIAPTVDPPPPTKGIRGPSLPAGQPVDPLHAAEVLRAYGVPVVETERADTVDGAVQATSRLGYPVVVKVAGVDITHRTDVDGVRTGIAGPDQLRLAAADLLDRFRGGLLLQPHVGGVEAAVGAFRDEQLGPMVMVGLGGVHIEILHDIAFAPAPLFTRQARQLIERLRGLPLLTGARGRQPVDVGALAGVVRAAGDALAARPEIHEIDLNPVLVFPGGAVAVDWVLGVVENRPAGTGATAPVRPANTSNGG